MRELFLLPRYDKKESFLLAETRHVYFADDLVIIRHSCIGVVHDFDISSWEAHKQSTKNAISLLALIHCCALPDDSLKHSLHRAIAVQQCTAFPQSANVTVIVTLRLHACV
jgi:hypothetical protein